ncbi:MAG: hypothetical protein M1840_000206 [Geoglossum simile]|nr:MAG: hypothetical protein M1840_000206 [Geoglossum simile]
MGIPCCHIIKERIAHNQILYQHDFHPRWFFNRPPEDFIQTAPRSILNPITVQGKGRPQQSKSQQPASSTTRDPSQFERTAIRGEAASKSRKRTRTGRKKQQSSINPRTTSPNPETGSPDHYDAEEDELMERELKCLQQSNGEAEPLWAEEPEFAHMTRATRSYQLRRKGRST